MSENLHLLPPGSDVFRIIISTSLMLGTSCPAGAFPADTRVDKVPMGSQDLQMWGYFQLSEGGLTSCFLLRRLWAAETPHHIICAMVLCPRSSSSSSHSPGRAAKFLLQSHTQDSSLPCPPSLPSLNSLYSSSPLSCPTSSVDTSGVGLI